VVVVNYELIVQQPNRLLVGLVLADNRFVAYGTVQMRFTPTDEAGQPTGETSQVVAATYVPVPGTESGSPDADPQAISPATARGAYELEGVRFGSPGPWVVEVAARIQQVGVVQGAARLEVLDAPRVPGVGEPAPRSDNAVIGDAGVDPASIDSRATQGARIPDPQLHRVSIADSIKARTVSVVVFSTPVYCISRFCGPVTEMVQTLATRYGARADFIHVEVWKDFQASVANDAANEWLNRDGTLSEPWLFIIGSDGNIKARWDNLFTAGEVRQSLDDLLGSR
jgi:hypothetical protein